MWNLNLFLVKWWNFPGYRKIAVKKLSCTVHNSFSDFWGGRNLLTPLRKHRKNGKCTQRDQMSPTAASQSIVRIQPAKKDFSVPSPSALGMLEKASGLLWLSFQSWTLGCFAVPRFPCAVSWHWTSSKCEHFLAFSLVPWAETIT